MQDMLVHLLDLPKAEPICEKLESEEQIRIYRPISSNKIEVLDWVKAHSGAGGAGECDVCFSHTPISCFIASRGDEILGYACYNATAPDFFGPTRVQDSEQGKGVGYALLLTTLHAMRNEGYVYAIIGGVGPVAFYEKTVGATLIADSTPGIYRYAMKHK